MSEQKLPSCAEACLKTGEKCVKEDCRMWINYEKDQNCSLVAIYQNGAMTLEEVAKRLEVSFVRVSQIEKQALKKLSKRIKI